MKKKKFKTIIIISMFIVLFPSISFGEATYPEPSNKFYINDFAGVIGEDIEDMILENGGRLEDETGAQVVLTTINFTGGIPIDEYAAELFNKWKLGSAEKNDGLLILLSIGDEDYWAVQGKGLEITLTSGEISQILYDNLEEDFAAEDYSKGAASIYKAFVLRLGGSWVGNVNTDSGPIPDSHKTPNYVPDYNPNYGTPGVISSPPSLPGLLSLPFRMLRWVFSMGMGFLKFIIIIAIVIAITSSRRRRYYGRRSGFPFFPFIWFGTRRYRPPTINRNKWNVPPGSRTTSRQTTRPGSKPFSSGGSSFGRSSSSGSSFGRSSGGSSFGGRSGGGGSTRGGGAGRRK